MCQTTVFESVLASLPKNAHYRRAWIELVRCFTTVERVLMRHFAQEFNSSLPRYDVLTALALTDGGLTMGELAAKLMVTKGNITGVVRRLKEDGLVRKTTSKIDRRIQEVSISAKGRRLWSKMHDDYDRMISNVMRARTTKDVQQLTKELEKMRIAVEQSSAES